MRDPLDRDIIEQYSTGECDEREEAQMNELIPATTPVIEKTEREQFCEAVRDFAAFFEAHPEVEIPQRLLTFYLFPSKEKMAVYARAFGKCRKSGDNSFFNLTKSFGSALELQAAWYRNQVCERVVVGKKKVEVPVMQEVGKKLVEEDVVEWKCPKVLEPLAPAELMQEEPAQISDVQF